MVTRNDELCCASDQPRLFQDFLSSSYCPIMLLKHSRVLCRSHLLIRTAQGRTHNSKSGLLVRPTWFKIEASWWHLTKIAWKEGINSAIATNIFEIRACTFRSAWNHRFSRIGRNVSSCLGTGTLVPMLHLRSRKQQHIGKLKTKAYISYSFGKSAPSCLCRLENN